MTKNIIFVVITMILAFSVQAQSYSIQRGHTNDDLYIYCRKNAVSNSVYQLYYLQNYGQQIQVQYTIQPSPADNDLNLKNIVPDPNPGVLFCTSLSNADSAIYRSDNYGKNWTQLGARLNGLTPPTAMAGGEHTGEVVFLERETPQLYDISSTIDFFNTHMVNAMYPTYFSKLETGFASGEVYGINNAYASNRDFLLHSFNFGVTIDTIPIDSSVIYNPNGNLAFKVCRGTTPGEVFLITRETEQPGFPHVFKIYHSTDYGSLFTFKNEVKFDENSSFTDFSGGRENCSFYVVNWEFNQTLQRQIMQVYYSSDCAQTFALHEYDLDEFVKLPDAVPEGALEIYPNPVVDEINLIFPDTQINTLWNVRIYDAGSKTVFENTGNSSSSRISVHNLKSGVYFVKAECPGYSFVKCFAVK